LERLDLGRILGKTGMKKDTTTGGGKDRDYVDGYCKTGEENKTEGSPVRQRGLGSLTMGNKRGGRSRGRTTDTAYSSKKKILLLTRWGGDSGGEGDYLLATRISAHGESLSGNRSGEDIRNQATKKNPQAGGWIDSVRRR